MLLINRKKKKIKNDVRSRRNQGGKAQEWNIGDITYIIYSLKQKLDDYQQFEIVNRDDSMKLAKLFDMGVISEFGDPIKQYTEDMN